MPVIPYQKPQDFQDMRDLPHNMEAEQSLLGMILLNNDYFEEVSDIVIPEFFSAEIHQNIFQAISSLISQGFVADPITLKGYFSKQTKKNVGSEYLIQLVNNVVSFIGAKDYANIIRDLYLRRQLIKIGQQITLDAQKLELDSSAETYIEKAETDLYNLYSSNDNRGLVCLSDILNDSINALAKIAGTGEHLMGVTTGLIDLDTMLGGLHKSDLIILAGRPSMGKTALATNIAYNAALAFVNKKEGGGKVAFFSLEMSSEQIGLRVLSQDCQISSERIRKGEIRKDEFNNFLKAKQRLANIPLFIDDSPALTPASIRARARKLKRQEGVDLIVIDYLQLLGGSREQKSENRVQEISEITRSLKCLAKELNVPIIALSQLSRAVEMRDDKRPQLSDLRESGSIEQDADIVMFVFREEYYIARREPTFGTQKHEEWRQLLERSYNTAEIIIAKQRHGPTGTVRVFFDGKFTKFSNLSEDRKAMFDDQRKTRDKKTTFEDQKK